MRRKLIGIVDYGVGNIDSLKNVLNGLGYRAAGCSTKSSIKNCDAVILPGVGAFPQAMSTIKKFSLDRGIKDFYHSGRPLIGICLGFQLFAKKSQEFNSTKGLSLIDAEVLKFPNNNFHIGWNEINFKGSLRNQYLDKYFYFNHSYYLNINNKNVFGLSSIESKKSFPAFYKHENLAGMQFHPEKSQTNGLVFLDDLLSEMLSG